MVKSEKQKSDEKLNIERGNLVVKRNDLIQKAHHHLSLQEQKIVLFLISKIKPNDTEFTEQEFYIAEYCKFCGMDETSGKNYSGVKDAIGKLLSRFVWIKRDNGSITSLRWIDKATINEGSGLVQLKFDKDLKPYLLFLEERYTLYEMRYTLAMRSQYSIRLYELLKSYEFKKNVYIEIEELKRLMSAENHKINNNFKRRVLEIAVREINEYTDISVTYNFHKEGRRFSNVLFGIDKKEAFERFKAGTKINEMLDEKKKAGGY